MQPSPAWPYIPRAQPDPWRTYGDGNPYGREFWIPNVFLADIAENGGFWPVGYVCSEAFPETNDDGDVLVVQYFERARLELWESGIVTRALLGRDELYRRYPERRAA